MTEQKVDPISILEDNAKALRIERARNNILHFTAHTKPDYQFNWHHRVFGRYIHRWLKGELPFLIIETPPRHGKSELFSVRLPAFIFGRDPNAEIIGASYGSELAKKNNRSIQRVMDSEAYREIFPKSYLGERNIRTVVGSALRNSDKFEIVGHRGSYRAAGVGGGITGMGCNFLIIDDPFKDRQQADSKTIRDNVWDWWSSTAFTRLEKDARVLLINTRWHEDDLAGRLLVQSKAGDEDSLPWVRVRFPAVFETGDKDNPVSPDDHRKPGETLWPAKYDEARMRQIKATVTTRDWNALYQQRPSVEEGGIVSKSWLKFYGGRDQPALPHRFTRMIQSWDLNFKEGLKVDFVVGQIWGEFGANFYLLDQFRERVGFVDTMAAIRDMTKKWPQATGKYIEEKANGAAVIDALKRGDPKNGYPALSGLVPVVPKESKEARLWAQQPLFKAGNVWYPDPSIAPWVKDTVDELVKFPNTRNDDTVDTTSQALNELSSARNNVLERMTR